MAVVMRGIVILFVWWFHRSLGDAAVKLGSWVRQHFIFYFSGHVSRLFITPHAPCNMIY